MATSSFNKVFITTDKSILDELNKEVRREKRNYQDTIKDLERGKRLVRKYLTDL